MPNGEGGDVRGVIAIVLVVAAMLCLLGCGLLSNAVSGTITYDGDPVIPDGAVVTVQVRDVSYQDAASTLIASQSIENPGRFPIDFSVPYEPDDIDSRAIYGLQISIRQGDSLIFVNDTAFDVLTRGNPKRGVDVWVVAVGR
ncbi:MAG: YbaY family lipoprotein [Chloroflexota bacterium]|nr:YbaY family lipoprotein [Chloroflexota bacterium]